MFEYIKEPAWGKRMTLAIAAYNVWVLLALLFVIFARGQASVTQVLFVLIQVVVIPIGLFYGLTSIYICRDSAVPGDDAENAHAWDFTLVGFIAPPLISVVIAILALTVFALTSNWYGIFIILQIAIGVIGTIWAMYLFGKYWPSPEEYYGE